ncbi:hypothetical protein HT136_01575 [Novosphingobium profundi]|uniref:hypothetical protein n=1 Tax=Novosphingobium profundi TaxID=1774954 RepID=UPI001BD91575|nr:hypothetical protein [Novosphingobium profundi]MBT0667057.1 hypothetical protein [Novosphingobium profundi]MED5546107.1 hypothetical protein [Pseudomonadota bacterium]
MAISEDTAALVAAQLTNTWATWFQQRDDVKGWDTALISDHITDAYLHFKQVAEANRKI